MKLDKKGVSYMGLMASVAIFLAIVGITGGFLQYVNNHRTNVLQYTEVSQVISAKISQVYNEDWDNLDNETLSTSYGEVEVHYELLELTDFSTKSLDVTFEKDGESVTYRLERSVYHE